MQAMQPVTLDLELHDVQLEVWNSPARFRVVACGRRWGKTFLGVNELIAAAGTKPRSINWWIAPLHDQTDVAFRFFKEALPPELVAINHTKKTALLWNGSIVAFKTASDPDALRSEGLDFVVLDEAAFQKSDVWPSVVRPALADKKGRALLIGTFDGRNWFYDMYRRGQDPKHAAEWKSWRSPSSANPFLDPKEIEEARRTTPAAEFAQEYEASPLVRVGAVFSGETLQRAIDRPLRGGIAYAGLDWGFSGQTALEVCREDAEGRISWVTEKTWTAVELAERCEAITRMCQEHSIATVYADAAAPGENVTLANTFKKAGLRTTVVPVAFGKWKHIGINTRRWFLENDLEAISPECPQLIHDSERYHYKEGSEDVAKEFDHTVDAVTAFYSSRATKMISRAA